MDDNEDADDDNYLAVCAIPMDDFEAYLEANEMLSGDGEDCTGCNHNGPTFQSYTYNNSTLEILNNQTHLSPYTVLSRIYKLYNKQHKIKMKKQLTDFIEATYTLKPEVKEVILKDYKLRQRLGVRLDTAERNIYNWIKKDSHKLSTKTFILACEAETGINETEMLTKKKYTR